jgi:hypothetical protein
VDGGGDGESPAQAPRFPYRLGIHGTVWRFGLKGHGNEADFLGFLQKSVQHRFLTLNFEPFRFGLRIRGDIRNRKTTPRLAESGS